MNRRNFVTSLIAAPLATLTGTSSKPLKKIYKQLANGKTKRVRLYELKPGDVFMFVGEKFTSQWFTAKSEPYLINGNWGIECT